MDIKSYDEEVRLLHQNLYTQTIDGLPEDSDERKDDDEDSDLNPNEGPGTGPYFAALKLVQTSSSGTSEALAAQTKKYNAQATALLKRGEALLEKAIDEDWGPGGWDPNDFADILSKYRNRLQTMESSATTTQLDTAKMRANLAQEMMENIVATETGALACFELGYCQVKTDRTTRLEFNHERFHPQPNWPGTQNHAHFVEIMTTSRTYFYDGKPVYTSYSERESPHQKHQFERFPVPHGRNFR